MTAPAARRAPFWRSRAAMAFHTPSRTSNEESRIAPAPRGVTPPGGLMGPAGTSWDLLTGAGNGRRGKTVSRVPCPGPFKLLQIDRCNFWLGQEWSEPGGAEFFALPCPPRTTPSVFPPSRACLPLTSSQCPGPRARAAPASQRAGLLTASLFFFFSLWHTRRVRLGLVGLWILPACTFDKRR